MNSLISGCWLWCPRVEGLLPIISFARSIRSRPHIDFVIQSTFRKRQRTSLPSLHWKSTYTFGLTKPRAEHTRAPSKKKAPRVSVVCSTLVFSVNTNLATLLYYISSINEKMSNVLWIIMYANRENNVKRIICDRLTEKAPDQTS